MTRERGRRVGQLGRFLDVQHVFSFRYLTASFPISLLFQYAREAESFAGVVNLAEHTCFPRPPPFSRERVGRNGDRKVREHFAENQNSVFRSEPSCQFLRGEIVTKERVLGR